MPWRSLSPWTATPPSGLSRPTRDGIDGSEEDAGAFVTPDTLARMRGAGVEPLATLAANDAFGAFAAVGDLLVTGPTRTNVNDLRAVLVLDEPRRL